MATKKIGYAAYRLSPLQKITAEAKKIRAKNPSMKWVDAVKKASKQYNAGSTAKPAAKPKPVAKSKPAPKKVVKKVAKKVSGMKELVKNTNGIGMNVYRVREAMEKDLIRVQENLKKWQSGEWVAKNITQKRSFIKGLKSEIKFRKSALKEQNKLINQFLR